MADVYEKSQGFATEKPDHIMISINGDACHQMAITWRTDISVKDGYVEYREENTEEEIDYALSVMQEVIPKLQKYTRK